MPVSNEWEEPVEDDLIQPEDRGRATASIRPLSSEQDAPPHTERKGSGTGIASFVISIIAGVIIFAGITGLAQFLPGVQGNFGMNEYEALVFLVLAGIGLFIAELVALGLGIRGLFQKEKKKILALLGTAFSSAGILALFMLWII